MLLFLRLSAAFKVFIFLFELLLTYYSTYLGSGKSHTVSTILENMLIPNFLPIGSSSKALCGLVLHYGDGGSNSLPSEAAWLSSSLSSHVPGVPVRVYVSRASFQTMKGVYSRFGEDKVTVKPLYFQNSELDAAAILSMMAVGSTESAPLYMHIILVQCILSMILSEFVLIY